MRRIYACDNCTATVFDDEEACALCGCTSLSDAGLSPLAAEMLLLCRDGLSVEAAARVAMESLAKQTVQTCVRELVAASIREVMKSGPVSPVGRSGGSDTEGGSP